MKHWERELDATVERWDQEGLPRPQVVVVAGSGLGVSLGAPTHGPFDLADWLPFEAHAVAGHALAFELLEAGGRPVLYYRGRLHAYQGFDAGQVAFPVRLAALLGASTLLLTNAAGGVGRLARPGTLALIRDHLNQTGLNPLRGRLPETWGPQFPDMVGAYDRGLRQRLVGHGRALGIELETGVYVGLLGPSYETPAEVEALRRLGAELIGMSTVLEVIAARQLGVRCAGLSLVTNPAAGTVAEAALDHGDVLEVGRRAAGQVESLLRSAIADPAL
ncbi:MAG TPA: purine-nucleoside phosphorylase [Thermoanaerobaculia bacterium]|nr:purine-nucleoside phosphorylase [Thermoanaerobaculia bacterium]